MKSVNVSVYESLMVGGVAWKVYKALDMVNAGVMRNVAPELLDGFVAIRVQDGKVETGNEHTFVGDLDSQIRQIVMRQDEAISTAAKNSDYLGMATRTKELEAAGAFDIDQYILR